MAAITGLVGVYDADGTVRGELAYWVGARLGRAHCALCDITHGSVRTKPEWKRLRASLPVPFRAVHRDEASPEVLAAGGRPAFVAAETADGLVPLLDREALAACGGSPEALVAGLRLAAEEAGLSWAAGGSAGPG